MAFKVDQILRLCINKRYRVWIVTAVKLGFEGQENTVWLECFDLHSSNSGDLIVPEDILSYMLQTGSLQ